MKRNLQPRSPFTAAQKRHSWVVFLSLHLTSEWGAVAFWVMNQRLIRSVLFCCHVIFWSVSRALNLEKKSIYMYFQDRVQVLGVVCYKTHMVYRYCLLLHRRVKHHNFSVKVFKCSNPRWRVSLATSNEKNVWDCTLLMVVVILKVRHVCYEAVNSMDCFKFVVLDHIQMHIKVKDNPKRKPESPSILHVLNTSTWKLFVFFLRKGTQF